MCFFWAHCTVIACIDLRWPVSTLPLAMNLYLFIINQSILSLVAYFGLFSAVHLLWCGFIDPRCSSAPTLVAGIDLRCCHQHQGDNIDHLDLPTLLILFKPTLAILHCSGDEPSAKKFAFNLKGVTGSDNFWSGRKGWSCDKSNQN